MARPRGIRVIVGTGAILALSGTGGVLGPIGAPGARPSVAGAVAAAYTWEPARVDGGGFVTVVAPSPATQGLWLAGSDVAGVFRSTDGGRTWVGATRGFEGSDQRKVGAIEWDPFNPARAWACVGSTRATGTAGAVVRTTDAGVTWATISTTAFCSGGVFAGSGVTDAHPRSIGRLLVADPTVRNRLWIGTLTNGVQRSTDGGVTWTARGLSGLPVRGLALDPADPNVLYAAVRSAGAGSGVYRTANANSATPTWTRLGGPVMGEELAIVGRRLYVAAGTDGLWAADLPAGVPTLARVGEGSLPRGTTTDVTTVSATVVRGVETVLAGLDADAVCLTATWCPTVFRSTDRGATWTPLPGSPSGVATTVGGPTGPVWRQASAPATLLGGANHVTGDVQIDPFTRTRILVAGRAGIWRSGDSGASWFPAVRGLTMTFHGQPATDQSRAGSVLVPTADWSLLGTADGGRTVQNLTAPAEMGTSARLTGWTGSGSAPLYLGEGFGAAQSELYVLDESTGEYAPLGFGTQSNARGVLAVAARDVGGQRVEVAIGRAAGVWRRVGGGTWTRVATTPGGPDGTAFTRVGRLVWTPGGALYASDTGDALSTGVWRSVDDGVTWERVTDRAMDIAADPGSPNRLWLAGGGEVWRVDDARAGVPLAVSRVTSVPGARLVTADPTGGVVVVTGQTPATVLGQKGSHGRVLVSTNNGTTFVDRTTDALRPGLVEPVGVAIDPTGTIHLATHGFGWWVGRPA